MAGQRRPYRGVHRGEGNAEEESKTQERVLEDYVKYVAKNTEIFSTSATFSTQRKYQFTIQKLRGTQVRNRSPKKWLGRH